MRRFDRVCSGGRKHTVPKMTRREAPQFIGQRHGIRGAIRLHHRGQRLGQRGRYRLDHRRMIMSEGDGAVLRIKIEELAPVTIPQVRA